MYLPDEECASHTKRVGDNKTVQFTTQELRRSASHWFILLNIPDTEKPTEDSPKRSVAKLGHLDLAIINAKLNGIGLKNKAWIGKIKEY